MLIGARERGRCCALAPPGERLTCVSRVSDVRFTCVIQLLIITFPYIHNITCNRPMMWAVLIPWLVFDIDVMWALNTRSYPRVWRVYSLGTARLSVTWGWPVAGGRWPAADGRWRLVAGGR